MRRKALKQKKIGIQPFLESGIHWAGIRNPVVRIRNPQRGIQNPRLSWIPLHGAKLSQRKRGDTHSLRTKYKLLLLLLLLLLSSNIVLFNAAVSFTLIIIVRAQSWKQCAKFFATTFSKVFILILRESFKVSFEMTWKGFYNPYRDRKQLIHVTSALSRQFCGVIQFRMKFFCMKR